MPSQTEPHATELESPWSAPADEVVRQLASDTSSGLTEADVAKRLQRYGTNTLREHKKRSRWQILWDQLQSVVVALLLVAAVVSALFGEYLEAGAIGVVVLINTALGFWMELGAIRSMEALREIARVSAVVIRDGEAKTIPAKELVPGDVVVLDAGDVITADMRIVEASKLKADESVLTGESVPVSKRVDPVSEDCPLAERESMVFKGTSLTRGAGRAVVVYTGMETELGNVSELLEEDDPGRTPLEERIDQFGRNLVWVCLGLATVIATLGFVRGRELFLVFETAVALAVATIPEGLPIVATISLARGMLRMSKRNALVKSLSAVETLGSTNIICTDKTGTLTYNHLTANTYMTDGGTLRAHKPEGGGELELRRDDEPIGLDDDVALRRALEVGSLCNNASISAEETTGDPLEVALLEVAEYADIDREALLGRQPEVREEAFDTTSKMMATFHETDEGLRVAVKGAPEAVFEHATAVMRPDGETIPFDDDQRQRWLRRNRELAEEGLRILALAERRAEGVDEDPYRDLTIVGLVGLIDPPRDDVGEALKACREAGIVVVMVTGDQPITARYVARAVGLAAEDESDVVSGRDMKRFDLEDEADLRRLLATRIFARVTPAQKLDIIDAHQDAGSIVAMTGDGVNDAPALSRADIGIAMGKRGTQVAREAADMVLRDDAFATIVAAVQQGRVIFNNIQKFVLYLLSCNVSELMVISIAATAIPSAPMPITPLQILYLNLVTDVFPALALGLGEGTDAVMDVAPRDPDEPILAGRNWMEIVLYGGIITVGVLGAFGYAFYVLGLTDAEAITVAFVGLAAAQLFHVFNMRDAGESILDNSITRNPYVRGAVVLCIFLIVGPVFVPGINEVLSLSNPGWAGWGVAALAAALPWFAGLIIESRLVRRIIGRRDGEHDER